MSNDIYRKSSTLKEKPCAACGKPTINPKFCCLECSYKHRNKPTINTSSVKQKMVEKELLYIKNPKTCLYCNMTIPYKRHMNKFCNQSCSAKFNNKHRGPQSEISKKKRSETLKGRATRPNHESKNLEYIAKKLFESQIVGPYIRVYLCKCKITGKIWYSKTIKTIHPDTIDNKSLYRYQTRFTFCITDYADWFMDASALIKQYGWYSAANRKNNLEGCSRDHLYSVSDGFKNGVDPKILAHPANCRIIPHRTNQNKHSKSSITLEELMKRITMFEQRYH